MARPGPPRCVCQHDNRHQTPPTPPPPGAATDCRAARRYILVIACPLPRVQPLTLFHHRPHRNPLSPRWLSLSRPSLYPCYRHCSGRAQSGSFRNTKNRSVSRLLFLAFVLKSISGIDHGEPRLSFRGIAARMTRGKRLQLMERYWNRCFFQIEPRIYVDCRRSRPQRDQSCRFFGSSAIIAIGIYTTG